jgi:RNA polymerase sigma-70 factor (ECF subfamily)
VTFINIEPNQGFEVGDKKVDLTDEALVANYRQSKDPTLFKSLIRRYENRLYNAAFRMLGNAEEAEEVVQDTCIKLHQSIDRFRSQCSFAAWIFQIEHNTCLDKLRSKQRRKLFGMFSFDPQSTSDKEDAEDMAMVVSQAADSAPNPAETLDLSEQNSIISESLRQLPESQRAVVVLHDIEGFSYQEISEIVGANIGTVRSRLHYGRIKLRELLEPYFQTSDIAPASR